jgi:undecaprenyldiphospho-muramoylpentapeptide beta-N-acetylglucosaminyltransferase
MKVLVTGGGTGGHVNPAIAVANTIRDNIRGVEIAFVGTERGIENKLVPKEGYILYHINIQGIRRKISLDNIKTLYLAYTSVIKAKKLIKEYKPDLVFGTGGYVCWPVLKAAAKLGIPTALQECNAAPGFAVKMLEKYVDRIFVNFDETRNHLKYPEKAMRVGNPIRNEFMKYEHDKAKSEVGLDKYKTYIISCGGSMGAEPINDAAIDFMEKYVRNHSEVYHLLATGSLEYEAAKEKFNKFGLDKVENVKLVEYIYDMPLQMAAADIIINRAGANTLAELAAMKKPCVLIPSPYVTDNHQYKNAKVLADGGAAVLIEEKELGDKFFNTLSELLSDDSKLNALSANIEKFAVYDTSKIIFKELTALAKNKKV